MCKAMVKRGRTRLLGFGTALVAVSVLALGACNSGSASKNAQGVSGATQAERPKATTSKETPRSQSRTLVEVLASKVKALETK